MSSSLADGTCVPCKKGAPSLAQEDVESKLQQLNNASRAFAWDASPLSQSPSQIALQRTFKFRNFKTALAFTNSVGAIAEEQKHHPLLVLEWGSVHVAWWTHATGGLHDNDFICAAKTSQIADDAEGIKK
ncbi:pterin-4-alpha-carbinolamine dehydratase [Ceraceosorus guamensis]|uniref:4a-hydroxytetrahydrobiopterin dehydratase n=1 Tax=Ceraceosorus guamensis TaxID=1522189 RepID=A0A316W6G4_9BASI|nr:pterin-4-alpha-carbinolamine dehydratase [Ceraceosorus guamensis]PWN43255.1 pterin-4-alpha-carbinolamine dehydratase [Ceraceosorus guamensis]